MGSLHIGADTAKPEQVGFGLQQGMEQFVRRDRIPGQAGERLDLVGQRDRLGRALEDTAAFRQDTLVVIGPA